MTGTWREITDRVSTERVGILEAGQRQRLQRELELVAAKHLIVAHGRRVEIALGHDNAVITKPVRISDQLQLRRLRPDNTSSLP